MKTTLLTRVIALLFAAGTPAYAQQSPQSVLKDSPNIANAQWKDYKDYYPSSKLCRAHEITLWTCNGKNETFSLCSSRRVTKTSGYIQYRAGSEGHITFRVPSNERPPLGVFSYGTATSGDANISFHNSGYEYTLYDALRGSSSIEVKKQSSGDDVANIACSNPNQSLQLNYTIKLMVLSGIVTSGVYSP